MSATALLPFRTEQVKACPVCGASSSQRKFTLTDGFHGVPGSYDYVTCDGCGSVHQNPMIIVDDLPLCYPTVYYTHFANPDAPTSTLPEPGSLRDVIRRSVLHAADGASGAGLSLAMKCVGRVLAMIPAVRTRARFGLLDDAMAKRGTDTRCLEVGPGRGLDLLRLKWLGWTPVGLDFDPVAADNAQTTSECEVRVGSLIDTDFENSSFDLIYMSHVIEHLPDVVGALRRCLELLKPGGRLVLVYPNHQSLGSRTDREVCPVWDTPRHLVLPTSTAIVDLLRRVGFHSARASTNARCALYNHLMARQIRCGRGEQGVAGEPVTLRNRLFAFTESLLVALGLPVGEEIIAVAYKNDEQTH